ncbi:HxsD-like protein [Thermoproteota archaeon]
MDQIKILLNKKMYHKPAVIESIDSFSGICTSELEEDNTSFHITLIPTEQVSEKEIFEIRYEFCNHCLANSKQKFSML